MKTNLFEFHYEFENKFHVTFVVANDEEQAKYKFRAVFPNVDGYKVTIYLFNNEVII